VLIGTETFKQIFTPYLSEGHSYFITSDSLLNAYHVLFEESILGLEERNARLLPDCRERLGRAGAFEKELDIENTWRQFEALCRKLEVLAHKQLRGVPFSGDEKRAITGYGHNLAFTMLYRGNSYRKPRDDAPKIIDVVHNPVLKRHLEVGVGRPMALYVLYPAPDGDILCRGAVMSYYEFAHDKPLMDEQRKALLDSGECPKRPAWIEPIRER